MSLVDELYSVVAGISAVVVAAGFIEVDGKCDTHCDAGSTG